MSNEQKLSKIEKPAKPYVTPQLVAYGDGEKLTRGSNSQGTRIDAYSQLNRPAKAPAPTPAKKP